MSVEEMEGQGRAGAFSSLQGTHTHTQRSRLQNYDKKKKKRENRFRWAVFLPAYVFVAFCLACAVQWQWQREVGGKNVRMRCCPSIHHIHPLSPSSFLSHNPPKKHTQRNTTMPLHHPPTPPRGPCTCTCQASSRDRSWEVLDMKSDGRSPGHPSLSFRMR